MNDTLQHLMREATRLTRSGNLAEATQVIQRALGHAKAGVAGATIWGMPTPSSAVADPADPAAAASDTDGLILDGCVFEASQPHTVEPSTRQPDFRTPGSARSADTSAFTSPQTGKGSGDFTEASHTHATLTRRYKLYSPPDSAGKSLPLVVMLHGCTQNPDDFAAGTRMNEIAREQDFYVLYPAQSADANPQRCWNWFKHNHQSRGRGEAALLADMTLSITKQHGIDPRRVYIAGLSAGGAMAAIAAAAYPEIYAAVGVHSGLAVGAASNVSEALAAMRSGAAPARVGTTLATQSLSRVAVPTIVFHGDQDTTVHPKNGLQVSDQAAAALNGTTHDTMRGTLHSTLHSTTRSTLEQHIEQGTASGGRRFTRTVYQRKKEAAPELAGNLHGDVASGVDPRGIRQHVNYDVNHDAVMRPGAVVEHWLVHGGGHAWSGGDSKGSFTDPKGPDASREMLRFFLAHSLAAPHDS
jgi:poly(hydroxyalkanoate) depolymerase family esterase